MTVRFSPHLTVVAGLGRLERECLAGELIGALTGSRSGGSLEVEDDSGRVLEVGRPIDGSPHRVVELEGGADVTASFVADGRVDLLAPFGLPRDEARRRLRLRASDLATAGSTDELVASLAVRDQDRLWRAAASRRDADAWLTAEAAEVGADVEDASLVEEIERRHRAFEAALRRSDSIRHHGIFVGGACALGAGPAALLSRWAALPFLAVAVVTTLVSIAFRRRMVRCRRAERAALTTAGADSYLAFHLQRVNGLLDGEEQRERLGEAVEHQRRAAEAWEEAAGGEVDVERALAVRSRVEASADGRGDPAARDGTDGGVEELAAALSQRLRDADGAGAGGRSLPLVLDEPLAGLDPTDTWELLELVRTSDGPQVVYLTEDAEVAAWARAAAAASGGLTVIEPAGADQLRPEPTST